MSARSAVVLRGVKKSFPLADGMSLEVVDVEHLTLPGHLYGPPGAERLGQDDAS